MRWSLVKNITSILPQQKLTPRPNAQVPLLKPAADLARHPPKPNQGFIMSTATQSRYVSIALDQLWPSPFNPRKHFADDGLQELAESLKAGQIEPIVVRAPYDGQASPGYEILAGERRYRAALLAGLPALDAKIESCDDQRALEITVVENMQRIDLSPLEEASGVATLLTRGWSLESIAADLGKSPSWVSLRAKLSDLSPKWRKALESKHDEFALPVWPASMLELVARFPIEIQDKMLEDWGIRDAKSTKELQEEIDRSYLLLLKSATWDLDDAKLIKKAGACSACPKRTGCQQLLFTQAKDDRCTDAKCWAEKETAFVEKRKVELKAELPNLVEVNRSSYNSDKKVLGYSEFKEVKKSTPKSIPALVIDGKGKGEQIWITKGKGGASSPVSSGAKLPKLSDKERLEQKLRARREIEVDVVKHLLTGCKKLGANEGKGELFPERLSDMGFGTVEQPVMYQLFAMAAALGLKQEWRYFDEHPELHDDTWLNVQAHMDLDKEALEGFMWHRLIDQICEQNALLPSHDIGIICTLTGLDAKAIRLAVQNAKPLPSTLAALYEEDGTPRTGVTGDKSKKKKVKVVKAKSAAKERARPVEKTAVTKQKPKIAKKKKVGAA
jgi:ParB/RepB/Spo0J family partition protein